MLDFLKKIISAFNVGPDGTHIAVIAYSSNAVLEFTFNTLSGPQITAEEYGTLIDSIRFQRGFTYIDKALIMADEQVFIESAGMRPTVPQVIRNKTVVQLVDNAVSSVIRVQKCLKDSCEVNNRKVLQRSGVT